MGMALVEPEAEPATAAKAILSFCGQEPEKPLLLLGGVYNRQLVTAMDIEVCRRADSLQRAALLLLLRFPCLPAAAPCRWLPHTPPAAALILAAA